MNYLYFAEGTVDSTHEAAMYPASSFTGLDPISSTTTRLSFKAANGTAADDDVLISHSTGVHYLVAELIANLMEPNSVTKNKFVVVADELNSVYADIGNGANVRGTVEVTLA